MSDKPSAIAINAAMSMDEMNALIFKQYNHSDEDAIYILGIINFKESEAAIKNVIYAMNMARMTMYMNELTEIEINNLIGLLLQATDEGKGSVQGIFVPIRIHRGMASGLRAEKQCAEWKDTWEIVNGDAMPTHAGQQEK